MARDAFTLREEAKDCRRRAQEAGSLATIGKLLKMADRLEQEANQSDG